jgi:hypothetical protein
MLRDWIAFSLAAAMLAACGGSFPPPDDRLRSTEASVRSAQDLGAANTPQAALHVKLAQEQLDKAKQLMKDGENQRADSILLRATADAELAALLAKETSVKSEAAQVGEQVRTLRNK